MSHCLSPCLGETFPTAVNGVDTVVGKLSAAIKTDVFVFGSDFSFFRMRRPPSVSAFVRTKFADSFVRRRRYFLSAHHAVICFSFFTGMSSAPAFYRVDGQIQFGCDFSISHSVFHETGNHNCLFVRHIICPPVSHRSRRNVLNEKQAKK